MKKLQSLLLYFGIIVFSGIFAQDVQRDRTSPETDKEYLEKCLTYSCFINRCFGVTRIDESIRAKEEVLGFVARFSSKYMNDERVMRTIDRTKQDLKNQLTVLRIEKARALGATVGKN